MRRPVVGIPCDRRIIDGMPFHGVGEEYIGAVAGIGALPLLIPASGPPPEVSLPDFDGFLFTGAASNVAPALYGGTAPRPETRLDPNRDATTLPLMRAAVQAGVPVFAICRGFQELNVAFGGTLHQHVHEIAGCFDHREDESAPLEAQYASAHPVRVDEHGLLARIVGAREFPVNSLHGQGIERLAPPLHADARAPDGLVEAVSMPDASGFVLGVQWHPEWDWSENEISRSLFAAFGVALRPSR